MTDVATIISAARIGWQLLAKVPWLTGGILRRVFPVSACRDQLRVDLLGSHSAFELLEARPSHALANLELRVYNRLPFAVTTEATRLQARIDSSNVLDVLLKTTLIVPAAGTGHVGLPEISLTEQQVQWVRNLRREYTRVNFTLHWYCNSRVHAWEASGESTFPVFIRTDDAIGWAR